MRDRRQAACGTRTAHMTDLRHRFQQTCESSKPAIDPFCTIFFFFSAVHFFFNGPLDRFAPRQRHPGVFLTSRHCIVTAAVKYQLPIVHNAPAVLRYPRKLGSGYYYTQPSLSIAQAPATNARFASKLFSADTKGRGFLLFSLRSFTNYR